MNEEEGEFSSMMRSALCCMGIVIVLLLAGVFGMGWALARMTAL